MRRKKRKQKRKNRKRAQSRNGNNGSASGRSFFFCLFLISATASKCVQDKKIWKKNKKKKNDTPKKKRKKKLRGRGGADGKKFAQKKKRKIPIGRFESWNGGGWTVVSFLSPFFLVFFSSLCSSFLCLLSPRGLFIWWRGGGANFFFGVRRKRLHLSVRWNFPARSERECRRWWTAMTNKRKKEKTKKKKNRKKKLLPRCSKGRAPKSRFLLIRLPRSAAFCRRFGAPHWRPRNGRRQWAAARDARPLHVYANDRPLWLRN